MIHVVADSIAFGPQLQAVPLAVRLLDFALGIPVPDDVLERAFPEAVEKWQISLDGGGDPQWRADSSEIFYVGLDGTLMAAPVSISSGDKPIEPRKPVPLFHTRIVIARGRSHQYAVTRNGQRFLLAGPMEPAPPPITVLLNWAKR